MPLQVSTTGRELALACDGEICLHLSLDHGGCYRLVAPDVASLEEVVHALELTPGVAILSADGGLLGTTSVAENLSLALYYGAHSEDASATQWEPALQLALQMCGLSEARIRTIGRERPINLEPHERWLIGLVRNILRPPDVLVIDRVFSGLSRAQTQAIVALEAIYHDYYPFRPTLFVDLDSHELPHIPHIRQSVELKALSSVHTD